MDEGRSGTGPARRYREGGPGGAVLWDLESGDWTVAAVCVGPQVARELAARLNASVAMELPAVAAAEQRLVDLQAEIRRQLRPLERQSAELRDVKRRAMEMAEQYRRAAAASTGTSVAATQLRHQWWAQARAVYAVFGVTPPRIPDLDPDPLDRDYQTTTGG